MMPGGGGRGGYGPPMRGMRGGPPPRPGYGPYGPGVMMRGHPGMPGMGPPRHPMMGMMNGGRPMMRGYGPPPHMRPRMPLMPHPMSRYELESEGYDEGYDPYGHGHPLPPMMAPQQPGARAPLPPSATISPPPPRPKPPPTPPIREEDLPPHNECEILIMEKFDDLDAYADMIEREVKDMGLSVDQMYPNSDTNIKTFIGNLAKRGTKLGLVLSRENANHKSVTLYVMKLNGKFEEHRNMPLKSSYQLIKDAKATARRSAIAHIPDDVKSAIQGILNDNLITDKDYNNVLKYLQSRWSKQLEYEGRKEYDKDTGILSNDQLKSKISDVLGIREDEPQKIKDEKLSVFATNIIKGSRILTSLQSKCVPAAATAVGGGLSSGGQSGRQETKMSKNR